jgi:AraC-like DNA-binding protein
MFLQRLKMNRAAAMLESGHLLVREVADLLGMDAFHFSRVFKRIHGLSPSTFASERVQLPGRATQSVGVSIGNGLPGLRRPTA